MKRFLLLSVASIGIFSGCSKEETPHLADSNQRNTIETLPQTPVGLKTVALTVAQMGITPDMVSGLHRAISIQASKGTDEHLALSDLFKNSELRGLTSTEEQSIFNFTKAFTKTFIKSAQATELRATIASEDSFDLPSFLAAENATLYWPYSEDWDGVSVPTIAISSGDDKDSLCVGYKLKKDGNHYTLSERILVDEDYALKNPVWVINREAMPKEDYHISENLRATAPIGSKFSTLYLGSLRPTKHHDAWHKGGDEYRIEISAPIHTIVDGKVVVSDKQIVKVPEDFKRKEIRRRVTRTLNNVVLVSVWQEELDNVAVYLYENDPSLSTGEKPFSLSATWAGKKYELSTSLTFDSGDDLLYRGLWESTFIFSSGNFSKTTNTWREHYANGLYYTLPFKTNKVIYNPLNPNGFEND